MRRSENCEGLSLRLTALAEGLVLAATGLGELTRRLTLPILQRVSTVVPLEQPRETRRHLVSALSAIDCDMYWQSLSLTRNITF